MYTMCDWPLPVRDSNKLISCWAPDFCGDDGGTNGGSERAERRRYFNGGPCEPITNNTAVLKINRKYVLPGVTARLRDVENASSDLVFWIKSKFLFGFPSHRHRRRGISILTSRTRVGNNSPRTFARRREEKGFVAAFNLREGISRGRSDCFCRNGRRRACTIRRFRISRRRVPFRRGDSFNSLDFFSKLFFFFYIFYMVSKREHKHPYLSRQRQNRTRVAAYRRLGNAVGRKFPRTPYQPARPSVRRAKSPARVMHVRASPRV